MEIIEDNKNLPKEAVFNLSIKNNKELIGNLTLYKHPQDSVGGEVHLEITPKWQSNWISESLKENLMNKLINAAYNYKIHTIYGTAITPEHSRLLEFAGFTEYNVREPKTYYYLMIDGA
jgi:N-acetylglutamate synthase-like GNAT family acetyltransferase